MSFNRRGFLVSAFAGCDVFRRNVKLFNFIQTYKLREELCSDVPNIPLTLPSSH